MARSSSSEAAIALPDRHQASLGRRARRATALLWLIALAALAGCGEIGTLGEDETYHRPVGQGPWILVDLYHARKQNPEDYVLTKGDYAYQGAFAFRRAFDHLERQNYRWASIRTMPLSEQRLAGFDALFINLIHEERPDFTPAEIEAIQAFVRDGGGLFVITDHTNVYYHAERLIPLLEPMGIVPSFHTATDQPPEHSVAGTAWILVDDFAPHPITAGLEVISFQTGGPLRTDAGVAFTSEDSYGDLWDESTGLGFYGNWRYDGDETLEPRGPLAVVGATEYGQGRVVVVGDQNIFGDTWLHLADNFALWTNAMQWVTGQDTEPPLRDTVPAGLQIGIDAAHNQFLAARGNHSGYYRLFEHLNRDRGVTAGVRLERRPSDEVWWLIAPDEPLSAGEVAELRAWVDGGGRLVVAFSPERVTEATADLLYGLAPEFTVVAGDQTYGVAPGAEPRLDALRAAALDAPMGVGSLSLGLGPAAVGDADHSPFYAVRSDWGMALLEASGAAGSVSVARHAALGDGELIVVVQSGLWRNDFLGDNEADPPPGYATGAVDVLWMLLDYLKSPISFHQ